jgi:acyl-CoA reductase-like NAD-dependent aldehyde dehydrogenase
VCALITPWNFPLVIASWKLSPALACGNTIVVKPASLTPLSLLALAEILARRAARRHDVVPAGSGVDVGNALVTDPRVSKVGFTGSTEVGRRSWRIAAGTSRGSRSSSAASPPNVVFADADMEHLRRAFDVGGVREHGQDCCARSRSSWSARVRRFLEALRAKTDALAWASRSRRRPTWARCLAGQRQTSLDYLEIGQKEGARLVTGGEVPEVRTAERLLHAAGDPGRRRQRVAGRAGGDLRAGACVIPFDTEEEAIRLANADRLRPLRLDLDPRPRPGIRGQGHPHRRAQRELLAQRAHRGAVRRLQAQRHRPRDGMHA